MRLVPPVSFIERWVRDPVTFDVPGRSPLTIGRGEMVGVSTLAANRDPDQFADPTRFDVTRSNASTNLSFSHGRHHCIGIHLARAQIAAAVGRVLALPGVRIVHADEPSGFVFRRPASVRIAWSP
jgi:cytochrome P450